MCINIKVKDDILGKMPEEVSWQSLAREYVHQVKEWVQLNQKNVNKICTEMAQMACQEVGCHLKRDHISTQEGNR